ncbi:mitochondrial cytochrome c peroxidase [Blastocladiella britannica]|nr:mitochondrial cytochrome c peroxidase [Blastocladiella britannica]
MFARAALRSVSRTAPAARGAVRRSLATEAAKSSSSKTIPLVLGLVGAAGASYYYGIRSIDDLKHAVDTAQVKAVASGEAVKSVAPEPLDYSKVAEAIADVLDNNEWDDGSYGPVLIRLAWHASGTYDKKDNSGGSGGAGMRYSHEGKDGANAGLDHARALLEPIKQRFPEISYADLWTLAGVVAVKELGGPSVEWRSGRSDFKSEEVTPNVAGRLPDATQGRKHVRDVFYRMGFDDREIVALMGAHALGRCHTDRSGFDGPWTFSPTMLTNDFYKLLLSEKWVKRDWEGPLQYTDKKTKTLMMLPTDMEMYNDRTFYKHVKEFAADEKVFHDAFASAFKKLIELGVTFDDKSETLTL